MLSEEERAEVAARLAEQRKKVPERDGVKSCVYDRWDAKMAQLLVAGGNERGMYAGLETLLLGSVCAFVSMLCSRRLYEMATALSG